MMERIREYHYTNYIDRVVERTLHGRLSAVAMRRGGQLVEAEW
jgi:hypothetical protein